MFKPLLSVLFASLCLNALAQNKFEPGYFIDNAGKRTDCLIENKDKEKNPSDFRFKMTESGVVQTASRKEVSQFEIFNTNHKYQRQTVRLEQSSKDLKSLSTADEISFKEEEVFLRVLVEGSATLYVYLDKRNNEKYFYKTGADSIVPLLFYQYLVDQNRIGENNKFRQQLWADLKCSSLPQWYFERLQYKVGDLVDAFVRYNKCKQLHYTNFYSQRRKGKTLFAFNLGLNTSKLELNQIVRFNSSTSTGMPVSQQQTFSSKFSQKTSPVFGITIERVLPMNQNKWSLTFAPSLYVYKNQQEVIIYNTGAAPSSPNGPGGQKGILAVNYAHIALPVGIRYYLLQGDSKKVFAQATASYSFILNKDQVVGAEAFRNKPKLDQQSFSPLPAIHASLGYLHNNKFTVDLEYHLNKQMLSNANWKAKFTNSATLSLGYLL